MIINLLGITGSIFISLSMFPQMYKSLKNNEIKDLSILTLLFILVGSIFQLIYSFYYKIIPMIIPNVCMILNMLILLMYIFFKKNINYFPEKNLILEIIVPNVRKTYPDNI